MLRKSLELRRNEVTGQTDLYDVRADIGERDEMSARHPEMVEILRHDYKAWVSNLAKPLAWSMNECKRLAGESVEYSADSGIRNGESVAESLLWESRLRRRIKLFLLKDLF